MSNVRAPAPTGVVLVQPGWRIFSRDGLPIGEVIAVDTRAIDIRTDEEGRQISILTDTVVEQDEPELRARISLTAAEVLR